MTLAVTKGMGDGWGEVQIPVIKEATNMTHIKRHFYASHPHLNHYAIIPKGPEVDVDLDGAHDRARFGAKLPFEAV